LSLANLLLEWCEAPELFSLGTGEYTDYAILRPDADLWMCLPHSRFKVLRLGIPVATRILSFQVPITLSAYEQIGHGETLAWAAVATGEVEGHKVNWRLVYERSKDGRLRLSNLEADSSTHPHSTFKLPRGLAETEGPITATLTF